MHSLHRLFKSTAENVSNASDETPLILGVRHRGWAVGSVGAAVRLAPSRNWGLVKEGVIMFHPPSREQPATWSSPFEVSRELKHADRFFTASSPFAPALLTRCSCPCSPFICLSVVICLEGIVGHLELHGRVLVMYLYCANEHSDIPCASSQLYPLQSTVSHTQQV